MPFDAKPERAETDVERMTLPLNAAYRPHEIRDPKASGGCRDCGPAGTVFVSEPVEPPFGVGAHYDHFVRHVNDERKPCPTCCPAAHREWVAEAKARRDLAIAETMAAQARAA